MATRALLVIDVQNEYESAKLLITHPPLQDSLRAIGRAMDVAATTGVLVVVVQQDMPAGAPAFAVGTREWELHDTVAVRTRDLLVHKEFPGAFTGTGLEQWLRKRGVTTVTVVGYMTQHCVDTTARQAMHAGFAAEVLSDATGTLAYANAAGTVTAEELHRGHLTALHAHLAAVATTDAWIDAVRTGSALPIDNPVSSASGPKEGALRPMLDSVRGR